MGDAGLTVTEENGFEELGIVNLRSFLDHCQIVPFAFFFFKLRGLLVGFSSRNSRISCEVLEYKM